MDTSSIKRGCAAVRAMAEARGGASLEAVRELAAVAHPNLARDYPRLFAAALDPAFRLDMLDFMLAHAHGLGEDGNGVVDADTAVYQRLKDVYGGSETHGPAPAPHPRS
jgi:hypothetical protein